MSKRQNQSLIKGSFILLFGTVIVKIIGALFKLPLDAIIGGTGQGYFNSAYSLFVPLQTVAMAGFPAAISKMVAENVAKGRYRDVKRIYRVASRILLITGIAGTLLMFIFSFILPGINQNPDSKYSMLMMAPSIFFLCMMSIQRGYYTGLRNMIPTTVSQIIEAVVKLVVGLLAANVVVNIGMKQFETTGKVFGRVVALLNEQGGPLDVAGKTQAEIADLMQQAAKQLTLPYAAAAAIGGVMLGTVAGAIYLYFRKKAKGDGITREELLYAPPPMPSNVILKSLLAIAIPVALGAFANNLSSMLDSITVQSALGSVMKKSPEVIRGIYGANIPPEITNAEVNNYLYGNYAGKAITLFNLVPALTISLGVSALPAIASAWALRDRAAIKKNVESVLKLTALIAIPSGLGLSVLSKPIMSLLFRDAREVNVAAPLLTVMGLTVILLSLITPINSMLQAVGKAKLVVQLLVGAAVIKTVLNVVLVNIPEINLMGAPISSFVSYAFIVVFSFITLIRATRVTPHFGKVLVRPLFAGILSAATGWVVNGLLDGALHSAKIAVIIAIALAAGVYVIALFLFRAITLEDIRMLPKGEKIAKTLEKSRWIR